MARDEDILERMRRHPVGWRYAALERLLRRAGFSERRRRGSHRRWKHTSGVFVTLVDRPGDVKAVYVQDVVAAVARVRRTR